MFAISRKKTGCASVCPLEILVSNPDGNHITKSSCFHRTDIVARESTPKSNMGANISTYICELGHRGVKC